MTSAPHKATPFLPESDEAVDLTAEGLMHALLGLRSEAAIDDTYHTIRDSAGAATHIELAIVSDEVSGTFPREVRIACVCSVLPQQRPVRDKFTLPLPKVTYRFRRGAALLARLAYESTDDQRRRHQPVKWCNHRTGWVPTSTKLYEYSADFQQRAAEFERTAGTKLGRAFFIQLSTSAARPVFGKCPTPASGRAIAKARAKAAPKAKVKAKAKAKSYTKTSMESARTIADGKAAKKSAPSAAIDGP